MGLFDCLMPRAPVPDLGQRCATASPIVLLHGLGYRDDMTLLSSWNRIPDFLMAGGAKVFLGGLQAWGSVETNAAELVPHVADVLARTGAAKVNIIAHSKGGLDARYAISKLGLADRVASLTTVCTPHRGTAVADLVACPPADDTGLADRLVNAFAAWMGDASPDAGKTLRELSTKGAEEFNRNVPDAPGVQYQSLGTVMKGMLDDPLFALTHEILKNKQGDNDGMVPASSAPWGIWRGLVEGPDPGRGISHLQMIDFCHHDVAGVNIPMVYVDIAEGLKAQGL